MVGFLHLYKGIFSNTDISQCLPPYRQYFRLHNPSKQVTFLLFFLIFPMVWEFQNKPPTTLNEFPGYQEKSLYTLPHSLNTEFKMKSITPLLYCSRDFKYKL